MPRKPRDAQDWLPDLIKAMRVRHHHAAANHKPAQFKYQKAETILRGVTKPVWVGPGGHVYNLPNITPPTLLEEVQNIARGQRAVVPVGMEQFDPDNVDYQPLGPRTMVHHQYFATIRKGTGAYAILRSMYEQTTTPDKFFTLPEIHRIAQPYADMEMGRNFYENRLHAGIDGLKTLEKYNFVKRIKGPIGHRHEIMLTLDGYKFAKAVFEKKFPEERVVSGGAYAGLRGVEEEGEQRQQPARQAPPQLRRQEPEIRLPIPRAEAMMAPLEERGYEPMPAGLMTPPFGGRPRHIEQPRPAINLLDEEAQMLRAIEESKSSAKKMTQAEDDEYVQMMLALEESKEIAKKNLVQLDDEDEELQTLIALEESKSVTKQPARYADDDIDEEDDDLHRALLLSLTKPDQNARVRDDYPQLSPVAVGGAGGDDNDDDDDYALALKRSLEDVQSDIIEIDAQAMPSTTGVSKKRRRKEPHTPITSLMLDLTASGDKQLSRSSASSSMVVVDLDDPEPARPRVVAAAKLGQARQLVDLSKAFTGTACYGLPRYGIDGAGFIELIVDTHERSTKSDYRELFYSICDKFRQMQEDYVDSTTDVSKLLESARVDQGGLRVGDFTYTWVAGELNGHANEQYVSDLVIERKRMSDLVQRSAGPMGDHAEQLCRLRCSACKHSILLLEGSFAIAGMYQPMIRNRNDWEGPDFIDSPEAVFALVSRQIVGAWPGYGVKVIQSFTPATTAILLAQFGVCISDVFGNAMAYGEAIRLPKLKEFAKKMTKQYMNQQRTDMIVDMSNAGVTPTLAEHISQRFSDWGLLYAMYSLCESPAHCLGLWDHLCRELNVPLIHGERLWRICFAQLQSAVPDPTPEIQHQLQMYREGARSLHAEVSTKAAKLLEGHARALSMDVNSTEPGAFMRLWAEQGRSPMRRKSKEIRIVCLDGLQIVQALIESYGLQDSPHITPHELALAAVQLLLSKLPFQWMPQKQAGVGDTQVDRSNLHEYVLVLQALLNANKVGGAVDALSREVNAVQLNDIRGHEPQTTVTIQRRQFPADAAKAVNDMIYPLIYLSICILMTTWNWHVHLSANEKETQQFVDQICREVMLHSFLIK